MDSGDGLLLRVQDDGRAPVVYVKGEVDLATAPQLETLLQDFDGAVVVDLSDVTFLDSSGIATLIRARKRLAAGGGELLLRKPVGLVARTLQLTGLQHFLEQ